MAGIIKEKRMLLTKFIYVWIFGILNAVIYVGREIKIRYCREAFEKRKICKNKRPHMAAFF